MSVSVDCNLCFLCNILTKEKKRIISLIMSMICHMSDSQHISREKECVECGCWKISKGCGCGCHRAHFDNHNCENKEHDWSGSMFPPGHDFQDGICRVCGFECDHDFDTEIPLGICSFCDFQCPHTKFHMESDADGINDLCVCNVCEFVCDHEISLDDKDASCTVCGQELVHVWAYYPTDDTEIQTYYAQCIKPECLYKCVDHNFCAERCLDCDFECPHLKIDSQSSRCVVCDTRIYEH